MEKAWEGHSIPARGIPEEKVIPLPWLTVEAAIYGLLMLAGLAVRLAALGRWPLQETGLNTALAAWRTVQGSDWRPTHYIPLLYDANLLIFGLTKATDAAARLLPALAGAMLVLLPYFARDILGRRGALAAALLFAFAPTWVYLSRLADGPILAAAAGALLLLALYRYSRTHQAQELTLGVIALAVGLTAGTGFYTLLLALALSGIIWWWDEKDNLGEKYVGLLAAAGTPRNGLLFLGTLLLLATGFLVNLGGVGATVDLLGAWAHGLAPAAAGLSWQAYPITLGTYEFLTVALALVAIIGGLLRRDRVDIFLFSWAALALLLGTALGHRSSLWLPDILLPLVLLAARGVERLWAALTPGVGLWDGVALFLTLLVAAFLFIEVGIYIQTGQEQALYRALFALGFLVALWIVAWTWDWRASAYRVGAAWLVVVMVALTIRATTAVAYQTGANPRESLVGQSTSGQMRDFEALLTRVSSHEAGDPYAVDIEYAGSLDPWMGWTLRDYPQAKVLGVVGQQSGATVVIVPLQEGVKGPSGSVGQRFRLVEDRPSDTSALSLRERMRWSLLRYPVGSTQATELEMWVRLSPDNKVR